MTTPRRILQIRFAALSFDPLTERVVSQDTEALRPLPGLPNRSSSSSTRRSPAAIRSD
jgi:hypothetical protein